MTNPRPNDHAETRQTHERRIAYFMLFRLAMLAAFTALTAVVFYTTEQTTDRVWAGFVWTALVSGYSLTIYWAWRLPRATDLHRLASYQTVSDIVLSAVVVQMTGGVDSGFASLYLISILGAATMGGPRQTWAAAGACLVIALGTSTLEFVGLLEPWRMEGIAPLDPTAHWLATGRTVAAIVGVTVLSSYLNTQLATSVVQVGKLRVLNENIVRSLSSGLVTVDLNGRLLYFNPSARSILELRDEQIGTDIETILPGADDRLTLNEFRAELDVQTGSGTTCRIGLSRTPLLDAAGERLGYVINFQDLTQLHALQQQVRRNDRLAAVGSLAASVAHEIRNPLAAISGSAELLGTAQLADEDAKLLAIIRRESTRLSGMVTDLLAFTRPRPPERRRVELATTVRESLEAFRTDPLAAQVELTCTLDDEDVAIEVDPAQLSQVLWNLLRNAAEAGGEGTKIELKVRTTDSDVIIEVQDDGPGIDPDKLETIFDPFFTTKEGGTGFGLAIVHRIVEDNGGSISASSQPGRGATFAITFPRPMAHVRPSDSGVLEL